MNLKKCPNGHFYDGDTYASCPHCQNSGTLNETVALDATRSEETVTVAMNTQPIPPTAAFNVEPVTISETKAEPLTGGISDMIGRASQNPYSGGLSDDQKTVSFIPGNPELAEKDPVVGWMICVKGNLYGQDFRLKSGRNFVGRSETMDICLKGEMTVSRDRHAIVIYEPKQNIFLVMPGETKELIYLNGDVVLMPTVMKKNDVLQLGDVLLMLVPFCDESFTWKMAEEL